MKKSRTEVSSQAPDGLVFGISSTPNFKQQMTSTKKPLSVNPSKPPFICSKYPKLEEQLTSNPTVVDLKQTNRDTFIDVIDQAPDMSYDEDIPLESCEVTMVSEEPTAGLPY